MTVSNNVRALRQDRLLTQAELAKRVGIQQPNVSAIERGVSAGSWRTQRRIAAALEVPLEQAFPDAA